MIDEDKKRFLEAFVNLAEMYGKERPSNQALKMMFAVLSDYTIEQIERAMMAHVKTSQFMPKPADLIKQIEGADISLDDIIAAARMSITPLGVLARKHIGKHDLDNGNSYYLKERAAEVKALLPEWRSRAAKGNYSDSELLMMKRLNVSPLSPFMEGMQPVYIENLPDKLAKIEYDHGCRINDLESQLLLGAPDAEATEEEIAKVKAMFKPDEIH